MNNELKWLSDAELAEIRARVAGRSARALLAHIAALQQVVRELTADEWAATAAGWSDYVCVYCNNGMRHGHDPTCPIVRGRELVGLATPSKETT